MHAGKPLDRAHTYRHIAARQGTLPILSNVLLRAEARALTLVTTNLELGMTYRLRGKVEEDGVCTVNAKLFTDIVHLLPKDRVDVTVAGTELELQCRGNGTKVRGMDAGEFPLIPTIEQTTNVRVDAEALRGALAQTAFAVASGESRPELGGVLWAFDGQTMTIAATDSYRLAERKIACTGTELPKGTSVIVPGRTIGELLRILGISQDDGSVGAEVVLNPTASQLCITVGGLDIVSRLIDGTYPDYTQILPRTWTTRALVSRTELATAARAASLFARTGVNDVHLRFLPNEKQCIVRSENAQLGEHQAILDAEVSGDGITTILNARYLLDGLAAIPGDRIAIEATGPVAPVVLKPETDAAEGAGYVYVIMPIKQ
ncbi:DNA polymerase III subunit beta [Candidatus Uhrbacteria bacterium]|nr:DNA polymerase III subunit beta [Candidatus Uhrbacteria bacterium]